MKPFLIIGGGSFGSLVEVILQDCGHSVAGFIDDIKKGPRILGTREDLINRFSPHEYHVAMAIGYKHLATRLSLFDAVASAGYKFPPIIHPTAFVSPHANVGNGCILMAGINIDAFSTVDSLCVLWPGSIISHDSHVGKNTFISPNATLCGFVNLGGSSFIGAGSVIVDNCTLPTGSFVKSGSSHTQTSAFRSYEN